MLDQLALIRLERRVFPIGNRAIGAVERLALGEIGLVFR
jgi:hypothetical protein